jgi:hypothetical protein
MALRVYQSAMDGDGSNFKFAVPWTLGLDQYLTASTVIRPLAMQGVDLIGDVIEAILQQDGPGGEVLHRLYKGPTIPLATLIAQLSNDAVRAGAITPLSFVAEKGMKLTLVPDPRSPKLDGKLVWNFCSDCGSSMSKTEAEG